jgi:AraC-like DNA-binding protein
VSGLWSDNAIVNTYAILIKNFYTVLHDKGKIMKEDIVEILASYSDLWIFSSGISKYKEFPWRRKLAPNDFDLLVCIEGKVAIEDNNNLFDVDENSYYLIAPGSFITVSGISENVIVFYIHFKFNSEEINRFFSQSMIKNGFLPIFYMDSISKLLNCFDKKGHLIYEKKLLLKGYLFILINALIELTFEKHPNIYRKHKIDEIDSVSLVLFINKNMNKMISVKDVAGFLGIGTKSVFQLFEKKYNMSPRTFIKQHKMRYAEKVLNEGKSVKQVAFETGYSDPYTFSRAFRKYFGTPPSSIKNRI